jgi:hypothetical protein
VTLIESPPLPRAAPRRTAARAGQAHGHRLRLCLDLLLDAAVLALGAAARETAVRDARRDGGSVIPRPAAPSGPADVPVPWRRWLNEDVDLICTLAAALPEGPPVLPSALDAGLGHERGAQVLPDLQERYEAIRDVLADVLAQPGADGDDEGWRSRLREALAHCQGRLAELATLTEPPRSAPVRATVRYLPGELLG